MILIRTVFDGRASHAKYICQSLLLAASWYQNARNGTQLDFVLINPVPAGFTDCLERFGATWRIAEPDSVFAKMPTCNTLLGTAHAEGFDRIVLVDNDVTFFHPVSELFDIPLDCISGGPAGRIRVKAEEWAHIKDTLGLAPLSYKWSALYPRLREKYKVPKPAPILPRTYFNGGFLVLPQDPRFGDLWREHILKIAEVFKGHPLDRGAVNNSNMAGLATAAGTWGKFQWLPDGYNFRPPNILMNDLPVDEIVAFHATGSPDMQSFSPGDRGLTAFCNNYWDQKIMKQLHDFGRHLPDDHCASVAENIATLRRMNLEIVDMFDLDRQLAGIDQALV